MKIISVIKEPKGGCEYYRQLIPLQAIKPQLERLEAHNTLTHLSDDYLKEFDAIQLIRHDREGNIDRCHKLGLKVIFDIDDYWNLDTTHLLYDNYKKNKIPAHVTDCIRKADLVTTTQSFLLDKIKPFNESSHIIPNLIPFTDKQWQKIENKHDKIRIGWVGGVHHIEDIKLLQPFFNQLWNSNLSDKVEVVLGGYQHNSEVHKYFAGIFSDNDNPRANVLLVEAMGILSFARMYEMCDILLAPLKDTAFNRCKSNLKIIEAGAKGKMVIASDIPNYRIDFMDSNIRWVNQNRNHKEWFKHIKDLVNNLELIKLESDALYSEIKYKFDVANFSNEIYSLYKSVI
jgi:glycosyltransferase involved in cell wall biosynthesis